MLLLLAKGHTVNKYLLQDLNPNIPNSQFSALSTIPCGLIQADANGNPSSIDQPRSE